MDVIDYLDTATGIAYPSRFAVVQNIPVTQAHGLQFRIPALDSHRFRRKQSDLDRAIELFLHRLRSQFCRVNLWYSGGTDSHLLLCSFVQHDVPLDEIFVVKKMPFDDHPYSFLTAEELYAAIPYFDQISGYIKKHNVKITSITLGSQHFAQHFQYSDWIQHTNHGEVRNPTYIRHVIKQFGIESGNTVCHLNGSETPFFYYDQGWRFYFIDRQIIPEISCDIYKPCLHDKNFLESYVNAIIDRLELYPDYATRFAKGNLYSSKWFAQTLCQTHKINSSIWVRYPKHFSHPGSSTDIVDRVNCNSSFKNFLDYRSAKELNPKWFQHYRYLTDWSCIERDHQFPGMRTQIFEIC